MREALTTLADITVCLIVAVAVVVTIELSRPAHSPSSDVVVLVP